MQAAQQGMLQSMQTFHDTVKITFIQLAGRSMTLLVVDFGGVLEGLHDLLHALLCCLHRCQVGLRHFDALALLGYRSPVHCILATLTGRDKWISELAECGSMTQKQGGTSKAKGRRKAARLPSCCWGRGLGIMRTQAALQDCSLHLSSDASFGCMPDKLYCHWLLNVMKYPGGSLLLNCHRSMYNICHSYLGLQADCVNVVPMVGQRLAGLRKVS